MAKNEEIQRLSSLDSGYETGDLSVYPEALDNTDTLFEVKNNAETVLKQSLTFLSKTIVVESTDGFPDKGILRIGPLGRAASEAQNDINNTWHEFELVYYDEKTSNTFLRLARGFAGSTRGVFPSGISVGNVVSAEPHNCLKDATMNIEANLGLKTNPNPESLNGILRAQEIKFLNPRPIFRASNIRGPAPLRVRFQNFSTGFLIRHFWDFGDGSTSIDENPEHTYLTDGNYTVTLNVMTSTGGQAVGTKSNYITVNQQEALPFFYVSPSFGLSMEGADELNATLPIDEQVTATEFLFVDQTDGDIVQRSWIFGDGEKATVDDPDVHTVSHIYENAGSYDPTLVAIFIDGTLKRITLSEPLVVS